jgi:NAD(P)-dependent dehydrogenase (short-subunit alcohol dehydrogenase family)
VKRVCLITGASGKLGSALSQAFVEEFEVIALYKTNKPRFPSQFNSSVSLPGSESAAKKGNIAYCVQGDLLNKEDVRRIVEVSLAKYGRIDVIINSAADVRFHGNLLDVCYGPRDLILRQLEINCIAPIELISTIFHTSWKNERTLNERLNRCVINVSSVSGLYVYERRGQAFYGTSKAALNFLTLYLASELAPYMIRANSICPARLSDLVAIAKVISAIRRLANGDDTGEVIEPMRA